MNAVQRYFVIIATILILDALRGIAFNEPATPMWMVVVASIIITALTRRE